MKNHSLNYTFTAIVLTLYFCTDLNAQSFQEKYEKETIYLSSASQFNYSKDGKTYSVGYFGKHIKKELEVSPDAMVEFDKYRKNKKNALWMIAGGAALYVSGAIIGLDEDLGLGLFYGGAGLAIVSIPFSTKANRSLNKSVWLRNRDVLK